MFGCIIAVGSEMLTPFRVDTNSLFVTEQLNTIGIDVRMKAVVGDDVNELTSLLKGALEWADVIVLTGGLGPTEDDITRDAVARVLHLSMSEDEAVVAKIRERFNRRGITMPEINRRQGMVPEGATLLDNPNGTAPGLWIERGKTAMVLLPGPPREMKPMFEIVLRERLAPRSAGAGLFRRVIKITGRTESDVDATVQPIYSRWQSQAVPISTTILAVLGQIELHLTATARDRAEAEPALDAAIREVQAVLGEAVYSVNGLGLEAIVAELLKSRKLTIATAESCSGGLLASRLTDVPGSSEYMQQGVVCYSNASKTQWADVPPALIEEYGAVSEPVAKALASGIRARASTDVGIGITGIAGPGGGTPEKPVGTVAIAVSALEQERVRTFQFFGARDMVKFQSSQAAMNMLRLMLLSK
jgi:nicotinamide-nucleotide amidase